MTTRVATTRETGIAAEEIAARFLSDQGFAIVARNYRCRLGEIDLIANDGDTLVFIEVRLRRSSRFGGARASITVAKQRKLQAAAGLYLSRLRTTPRCRFDAILLDALDAERIEWLRDVISV
ncbi:MAG: YraN family protein [Betaproteobacteria bacterium]